MKNNNRKKVYAIKVDKEACIGAGTCVVISPKAFELNEENIAVVKPGATELDDNQLFMAAQSCPTQAIHLFDENGEELSL